MEEKGRATAKEVEAGRALPSPGVWGTQPREAGGECAGPGDHGRCRRPSRGPMSALAKVWMKVGASETHGGLHLQSQWVEKGQAQARPGE